MAKPATPEKIAANLTEPEWTALLAIYDGTYQGKDVEKLIKKRLIRRRGRYLSLTPRGPESARGGVAGYRLGRSVAVGDTRFAADQF